MSKSHVTYAVCKDFGPEQSRNLRARAWAYVFNRYEAKKKAGEENAGDGMKGLEHDHPARRILPR